MGVWFQRQSPSRQGSHAARDGRRKLRNQNFKCKTITNSVKRGYEFEGKWGRVWGTWRVWGRKGRESCYNYIINAKNIRRKDSYP